MANASPLSVYEIKEGHDPVERRTISVLVDNESGVLGRVIGLFSSRGYNIESLTVNEVDHKRMLSRITIVTTGTNEVIQQIEALLQRIVPVYTTYDLTVSGPHIEREVGLIKVINVDAEARAKVQALADRFGARTIDSTPESFIFELSDMPEKIDKFIALMQPYGVKEICRTGVTAIARGAEYLEIEE